MPELKFSRTVDFSPQQMLSLVSDITAYPEFVPNCSAMEVSQEQTSSTSGEPGFTCHARMHVQFGPVSQSYTSRVDINEEALSVHSEALDGPFSHLDSLWEFVPEGEGTRVKLTIDFEISNPLLAAVAEPAFADKQEEILEAFLAEANRRYG